MAVVYCIYEVIFSGRLPWPCGSKPLRSTPELATPTRLSLVDQPSWFSSPPSGPAVHFHHKFATEFVPSAAEAITFVEPTFALRESNSTTLQ